MITRYLIVNADDLGLSAGINRGIIEAHEQGIVTRASLMVRQPGAANAAGYAREHPRLGIGLHLDLGEWVYRDGAWQELYRVVSDQDAAQVAQELARQLQQFQALVGRMPMHLDSHQHVHNAEPVRTIMLDAAKRLGVPLRFHDPNVRYVGDFYGQSGRGEPWRQGITVTALIAILEKLEAGVTELACHPGFPEMEMVYADERRIEVETLCDPRVRTALAAQGIELVAYPQSLNALR